MEAPISSDESSDSEMQSLKNELSEFGLDEENLSKEEMSDLLKALKNSKSTMKEVPCENVDSKSTERQITCENIGNNAEISSQKKSMKRRYLNVRDRRMPWSLLPNSITQAEKARTLAVYIKLMSINNYHQARQSAKFAAWPPPIQIIEETARVQPVRSTRSGRSVPVYDFDDDSSDLDFVVTKSKKRKVSTSEHNGNDGIYTNKVLSLKRKPSKEENSRPVKEAKLCTDTKLEVVSSGSSIKPKRDLFSLIED